MKKIFTLSETPNMNYVATICRIEELFPIENSDFLLRTVVNGFDIVVDNKTKVGDIVVYFPAESAISLDFLGKNNLFSTDYYLMNDNANLINKLLDESKKAVENGDVEFSNNKKIEAKKLCGFFNDKGRVKTITLRGCPSQGFITPIKSLCNWKICLNDILNWDDYVGTVFDTVDNDLLVRKYVPIIKENSHSGTGNGRNKKRNKKLEKFDRLYEDQFVFHYDTTMLNVNMHKFSPEDMVTMTKKIHGTSAIFANVLCRRKLSLWEKIKKCFGVKVPMLEYSDIYASRSVVKNRYINPTCGSFYSVDVWGWANEIMKPYLDEGMTVYAEIYGYLPGSTKLIQPYHDYGCNADPSHPRHTLIMPYRITTTDAQGNKNEWSVQEVFDWTLNLLKNDSLKDKIETIKILYHGKFKDLYSDIDIEQHWHENVLARMKVDTDHFHMEEEDPTCTKFLISGNGKKAKYFQAPIEGIVVRRDVDAENNIACAYKLKTQKHYAMESTLHDEGAEDIEEQESQKEESGDDI